MRPSHGSCVSSFWSYAGVGTRAADDPDAPRVAMSRKALVDAVYLDKDGNVQMRTNWSWIDDIKSASI